MTPPNATVRMCVDCFNSGLKRGRAKNSLSSEPQAILLHQLKHFFPPLSVPLNTCVHVVVLRLYQHSCRKGPTPRDANGKNEWHPGSLASRWRSVFLMSKGGNDQLFVYFKFLRMAVLIVRLRITHLSIVWSNTLTLIGINNPGDSSGVQSCPGRHPNHSAEGCFFLYSFFPPAPQWNPYWSCRGPQAWNHGVCEAS